MSQPPPLRRRELPPELRAVPRASGGGNRDDEKTTSGWVVAALVALALLLILLILAAGIGAWMSMGSSFSGDQGGVSNGTGDDSAESGPESGTGAALETPKQKAEEPPSKPSSVETPSTEKSPDASPDTKTPPASEAPPPEDVPAIGKETPRSVPNNSPRDENGPSVAGGSFFGVRAEGKRFVYVVDCSGSMDGLPYERATSELLSSIANLERSQQFFVILYSTESYPMFHPAMSQEFLNATDDALKRTKAWLREFSQGGGGTNPEPALEQALAMKPDAIFFLTDGAIPPTTLTTVRSANSSKTPVHAIGFVHRAGEDVLKQITEDNRGQYKFVP